MIETNAPSLITTLTALDAASLPCHPPLVVVGADPDSTPTSIANLLVLVTAGGVTADDAEKREEFARHFANLFRGTYDLGEIFTEDVVISLVDMYHASWRVIEALCAKNDMTVEEALKLVTE